MANTYSQITLHIIFAVKGRENLLSSNHRKELYKYISGIIKNKGQKLFAINGMSDHVHILLSIDPKIAISDLVRDIKNNSSKFINEKRWFRGKFIWQEGFGVFSYSRSQRAQVISYIANQEQHHKKFNFKEEYRNLLSEFEVDYDVRYIFQSVDDENNVLD